MSQKPLTLNQGKVTQTQLTGDDVTIDDTNLDYTASNVQEAFEANQGTIGLPLVIASGEEFTVPTGKQVIFAKIKVEPDGLLKNLGLVRLL
jgi:hypothetical protein